MSAYIIRRLLLAIVTLFVVTIIVFFSVRLVPGDVIEMKFMERLGPGAGAVDTKAQIEEMRRILGLGVPVHVQYVRWLGNILRGDLGISLWTQLPVADEIRVRVPVTLELGLLAFVVAFLLALPIGVYSAIRQDSIGDYVARSIAIACIALPGFWVATLVMVYPSIWWNWSPPMKYVPLVQNPIENLGMFIIPAAIMGMTMSGVTMRMTRTMMLEVLRQDYVRTAWAKGLGEGAIVFRHALKNALIPVITIVGLQLPTLIGGSVVIETIFNLPGMGRLLVEVVNKRDYVSLSAINLITAAFILFANLVVDLAYAYLDPRVHYT